MLKLRQLGMISSDRSGILPPPPPEIAGQDITMKFVSMLKLAQDATDAVSIREVLSLVGGLAGVDPQVMDVVGGRWRRPRGRSMRRGSSSYSRLIPLTFRAQYIGQARGHHQLQWEDVKRHPIQCVTGGHRHEKSQQHQRNDGKP